MLTINSVQTQRMVGYLGGTVQVDLVRHGVRQLPDEDHLLVDHVHVLLHGQSGVEVQECGSLPVAPVQVGGDGDGGL